VGGCLVWVFVEWWLCGFVGWGGGRGGGGCVGNEGLILFLFKSC